MCLNFKCHGGEVKEELEYRSAMKICRENPLLSCFRNDIIHLHKNFTFLPSISETCRKTIGKRIGSGLIVKVGQTGW